MENQLSKPNVRLLSLDAFRGMTVAAMILVNKPGDWGHIYAPFKHADWNGCTLADLIFPFFLFISGVSISYALGSKREDTTTHSSLIFKVFKRSMLLFALGLILAFIPSIFQDPGDAIRTVRIPGILQRIALVYLACALLFIKLGWRTLLIILVFLLLLYWVLMTVVPVPGVGYPSLDKETNLGAWLDRLLLTENHLWKLSKTWDPEGLLGTLPAIASGLSGVLTGIWLKKKDVNETRKMSFMLPAGAILVVLGLIWSINFPINKALWTSSYVLFTSGLAILFLVFFYWLIDIKAYKNWATPFVVYGANAITAFFTSTLVAKILNAVHVRKSDGGEANLKSWLYESFFTPYFSPYNSSLAFAMSFVLIWLILLWWMYTRKIIIKV